MTIEKSRRWRKARPHCGGWWLWREGGGRRQEKVLLCDGGTEVATDDEWEKATGRNVDAYSGDNYWEMTETTQDKMPGLWMQCNPLEQDK